MVSKVQWHGLRDAGYCSYHALKFLRKYSKYKRYFIEMFAGHFTPL